VARLALEKRAGAETSVRRFEVVHSALAGLSEGHREVFRILLVHKTLRESDIHQHLAERGYTTFHVADLRLKTGLLDGSPGGTWRIIDIYCEALEKLLNPAPEKE
jgi:hypothetical protein